MRYNTDKERWCFYMSKSAMIRARVEPELKIEVESIFKKLGLTTTEAITLFYYQVKTKKGMPFEIRIANETTLETVKKTDVGEELYEYESLDAFSRKMGI
jgi:DNA-damage-inducible protein J